MLPLFATEVGQGHIQFAVTIEISNDHRGWISTGGLVYGSKSRDGCRIGSKFIWN
jgi:hypothetical protein